MNLAAPIHQPTGERRIDMWVWIADIESFNTHVPKGYVYVAMAFAVMVELINIRVRRRSTRPAQWHSPRDRLRPMTGDAR